MLCLDVDLCTMGMQYQQRSEEGIGVPGTGVVNLHVDART